MFISMTFEGMSVDVQIDRNDQICDFIFPKMEPPSKFVSSYKEDNKQYDEYTMYIKSVRSKLLDKYRGRPYKLVFYEQKTD